MHFNQCDFCVEESFVRDEITCSQLESQQLNTYLNLKQARLF